jgi:hypothetical protein
MPTTVHYLPTPKMVRPLSSNYRDKEIDNGSDSDSQTILRTTRWKVSYNKLLTGQLINLCFCAESKRMTKTNGNIVKY